VTDDLTAAVARLREGFGIYCRSRARLDQDDADARAVCAALEQAQQENKELAREALQLAGERTFILGNDIPETLERARAVLVQRVRDAEAALAETQQEIERLLTVSCDPVAAEWQRKTGAAEAEALARTLARALAESCPGHSALEPEAVQALLKD